MEKARSRSRTTRTERRSACPSGPGGDRRCRVAAAGEGALHELGAGAGGCHRELGLTLPRRAAQQLPAAAGREQRAGEGRQRQAGSQNPG